jgi:hypothetical protein
VRGVDVHPGSIAVKLDEKCGLLPEGTVLIGNFVVGPLEDAYLDIRSVRTGRGDLPVCLQAWGRWYSAAGEVVSVARWWQIGPATRFTRK